MSSKQFKPKQPKARKKKSEAQKEIERKRNKAEDKRGDDVAKAQRRKFAILNDPKLFLTEGMGPQAGTEVLRQYNRVLAYNDRKAQDELADSLGGMVIDMPDDDGPTYAPESPRLLDDEKPYVSFGGVEELTMDMGSMAVDSPTKYYPSDSFPPGVKIAGKNLGKKQREHNKAVQREAYYFGGHEQEPIYPGNQAFNTDEEYLALAEQRDIRAQNWNVVSTANNTGGRQKMNSWQRALSTLPNPAVQDYIARGEGAQAIFSDFDPSNPFAPSAQQIAYQSRDETEDLSDMMGNMNVEQESDGASPGDYMYELEKEREADRALEEVRAFEDSQYNKEQREANIVPTALTQDVEIELTDEELVALSAQLKELKGKKKQAKSQEEKDYYKRAIADLQEGPTKAQKSRKRQMIEQQEVSSASTFRPQKPGINKYPGPANIQDGFAVVSTEVGRRTMTDDEATQIGRGITGETQRFSSDKYADSFGYQPPAEYSDADRRKNERETLGRVPVDSGFTYEEDKDPDDVEGAFPLPIRLTDDYLSQNIEYPTEWTAGPHNRAKEKAIPPKERRHSKYKAKKIAVDKPVSMINKGTKAGKGGVIRKTSTYNTKQSNQQVRFYGKKR